MIWEMPPPLYVPPRPAIIRPSDRELLANFTPGGFPAGAVAGVAAGPLTSISQNASATATTEAITAPADIQAGDLIVLHDGCVGVFGIPAQVVPADFSIAVQTSGTGASSTTVREIFSYKIANGSEASASLTGMTNGFSGSSKALYTFRGNVPILGVSVQSTNSQTTSGNPTGQTVTSSGGTPPLLVLGGYTSNGVVSPRTFSPAQDGELNASSTSFFKYKIYNDGDTPVNHSIDMDDEGDVNGLISCFLELT